MVASAAVCSKAVVLLLLIHCCSHCLCGFFFSFGPFGVVQYLVSFLVLQSSHWERKSWLLNSFYGIIGVKWLLVFCDSSSQWRGLVSEGAGGGIWYFHTYVGSGHFLGFKILNFIIILGFQKKWYFWGYEDFVDIFWGHHKIDYIKGSFICILGYFLKVKVGLQNGGYFLGCQNSKYSLGYLKCLIFFWGGEGGGGVNGICWARAYV